MSWQGKGGNLPDATFGGVEPIVVQSHRNGGVCTELSIEEIKQHAKLSAETFTKAYLDR